MRAIDQAIKIYINYKIVLSAATGVLAGVFLQVLRVDLAPLFGLLAFLLNFIPIGACTCTAAPAAALQSTAAAAASRFCSCFHRRTASACA
jgi:predicted PurR-regulated permease PerM